ncbi:double-strand break repair helicase AddA [Parvularcula oceani]|uniref:double-strand break repair helicase AddA n=1 Tax=Parvularcula oceani TaxID=1247963 RepID=UPI0004E1B09C|nr:double-strand break repair helicase AddA [Parvularcula oceani]
MADGTFTVLEDTTARQRAVADPAASAWVSANAGSGKTHVLIQRVTRLLLPREREDGSWSDGTPPSKILCITYTKAAAAEMASRLFGTLGAWALMEDDALREQIRNMTGEAPPDEVLPRARRLFARALETPGGLKIQTIHSFCESVLGRFPVEAGVVPGFKVMEEAESEALLRELVDGLAETALREEPELLEDFDLLGRHYREDALRGLLRELSGRMREIRAAAGGDEGGFCSAYFAEHGLAPGASEDDLVRAAAGRLDRLLLREIATLFGQGGKKDEALAEAASLFFEDELAGTRALAGILCKVDGGPTQFVGGKKVLPLIEDCADRMRMMQTVLGEVKQAPSIIAFCEANAALHRLGFAVARAYDARKAALGALDFSDLIDRTVTLFEDTSQAWVLYKLDQGLDHILLDEAQDTGALQWAVFEKLADEFFAGEGARPEDGEGGRTVFVVGDKKQSIYSFQGADAKLFDKKLGELTERLAVGGYPFRPETLYLSFRSSAAVLEAVDAMFEGEAARGVLGKGHQAHRPVDPARHGRVELWPLVPKPEKAEDEPWDAPINARGESDPRRVLATEICERIKSWIGRERLAQNGRPVRPGDILILCQTRGAQFQEVVRELARAGIPTAGADRVRLSEDVGVRDLHALLRFCVNSADCLSLAEVLRSPFWRLTDDELFALAHGRSGTLWARVKTEAEKDTVLGRKCRLARDEIEAARTEGLRGGAFALMSSVLENGHPTGWQRLRMRLGGTSDEAVEEVLAEALDFEARAPRTLQGFLAHLDAFERDVKKEAGEGGDTVRVMTVHGAKGLEAPIVILADAGHRTRRQDMLVPLGAGEGDSFAPTPGRYACVPGGKSSDTPVSAAARAYAERLAAEERRRLLYVAATRAEERLYVCGTQGQSGGFDKEREDLDGACWHTLVQLGFERLSGTEEAEELWGGKVLRFEHGSRAAETAAALREDAEEEACPGWLFEKAPKEEADALLFPSAGPPGAGDEERIDEGPAYAPGQRGAADPYARGFAIHALLERLPDLPRGEREARGRALLARFAAGADVETRGEWLAEALRVLDDARFGTVFGPGSRAEVPVQGRVGGRAFSGQIDRLLVTDEEILIVDFKSNRPPPAEPEGVPRSYLYQMAAYEALIRRVYPGRDVRSALLWTYAPRLMPLPSDLLEGALG